jgi:hypothetical protein
MRKESGKSTTGPIERLDKIDRLRKSLAENTYHVSSADLAQKIIDHMLQFRL